MKTEKGKLIVLEGIDGSGKTAQLELTKNYLEKKGYRVEVSSEPTYGVWGTKIRKAAEEGKRLPVQEEAEYLLLDRIAHAEIKIRPALKSGKIVLLDRYYPSTMAYQGASGLDAEKLRIKNEAMVPIPDCALWLDTPVELALIRIGERGRQTDVYEKREFLLKVREQYASFNMPWWKRIEAVGTIEDVQERIQKALHLIFPEL